MVIWKGVDLIGRPHVSGLNTSGLGQKVCLTRAFDSQSQCGHRGGPAYAQVASPPMLSKDEDEAAPDDASQAPITATFPLEHVAAGLRLTHVICYYATQRKTLKEKPFLEMDTEHASLCRII